VHAELFRGVGPDRDAAIPAVATAEAKAVARRRRLPPRVQSTPSFSQSRPWDTSRGQSRPWDTSPAPSDATTASSAVARTSGHDRQRDDEHDDDSTHSSDNSDTTLRRATPPSAHRQQNNPQTPQQQTQPQQQQQQQQSQKPLRIPTARRAVLLPASDALLPVPPWAARTFGHLPLIGGLLSHGSGGGAAAVGYDAAIPRDEQGRVDWAKAGFWWRACWWVDRVLGTDVLGMRGDE